MFKPAVENEEEPVELEVKRSCAKSPRVLLPIDVPRGSAG